MTTRELRLVVSFDDQGAVVGLRSINDETARTKDATEQGGEGVSGFGEKLGSLRNVVQNTAAAAVAFGATMKVAFDLGEEGAQIAQTGESFGMLLDKVGAAPDLLDQLKQASAGTIDDLSLMSSTSTLLAGAQGELATNLAGSTPRLLEIAAAASKLNPALGDTTFMYDSLALGIKRASPMILDNLGLTIKIGAANEDYARSIGKTVDQLTAEEQKIALLNATLDAGDVLIDQVGGSTEAATDSFARLTASIKNMTDEGKASLAPFLADAATGLELLLTWNDRVSEALGEQVTRLGQTAENGADYASAVMSAVDASGQFTSAQEDLIQQYMRGEITMAALRGETGALTDEMGIYVGLTGDAIDEVTEFIDQQEIMTQKQVEGKVETENQAAATEAYTLRMQGLAGEYEGIQAGQDAYAERLTALAEHLEDNAWVTGELTTKSDLLGGALRGLTGDLDQASVASGLLREGIGLLSESQVEAERVTMVLALAQKTRELATKDLTEAEREQLTAEIELLLNQQTELENIQALNQALEAGTIDRYDYIEAMADGIITTEEVNSLLGTQHQRLVDINGVMTSLPDGHTFELDINVNGSIPALPGGGGEPQEPIPLMRGTGPFGMVVPPGHTNDTYPVLVRSGERLRVTTPGEESVMRMMVGGASESAAPGTTMQIFGPIHLNHATTVSSFSDELGRFAHA